MNAACRIAKTFDDVKALCSTGAGAVLIGSITVESRDGNQEPRWYVADGHALNSFGMPNGGLKFYQTELPKMTKFIHDAQKASVLSIAGFSINEYLQLAELASESGVDILELNFGCPNASKSGQEESIVSFNPEIMQEIILAVQSISELPLMIKLSPYSNPEDLKRAARVLIQTNVAGVVASNAFPNGFMGDEHGKSVLGAELAGVSGRALLAINLGQVRQFSALLPRHMIVIGVGGVETKQDVNKYWRLSPHSKYGILLMLHLSVYA